MFGVLKLESSLEYYPVTFGGLSFTCANGQRFFRFVLLCLLLRTSYASLCYCHSCSGDMQFVGYRQKGMAKIKTMGYLLISKNAYKTYN